MRLDQYLAERKLVSSRTKGKNAVKSGLVSVNGRVVDEPDFDVKKTDKVEVMDTVLSEMPRGYLKLKNLLAQTRPLSSYDIVLDLGSSAGGYVLAAAETAEKVYGVEISPEFKRTLERIEREHDNVKITIDNVFRCDVDKACPEKVNVILNDMTLEPLLSFAGLERFLPKLKTGGEVIMTLKLQGSSLQEAEDLARRMCAKNNLSIIKMIESDNRDECFIYAQKLPTKFG